MKVILASALLAIALTASLAAVGRTNQSNVVAELPGSSLKWIHIAEGEFAREGLDLNKYQVSVVEEKSSVVVMLTGLKPPRAARGSVGPDPGYGVEISKKDHKVLRANYVR